MSGGLPPAMAKVLAGLDAAIASGIEDRTTDAVLRLTGAAPRTFREFAQAEFTYHSDWRSGIGDGLPEPTREHR